MAVKKTPKKQKYPMVKIKLKKSLIGRTEKQRAIVKGLGLRKLHSQVIREKRPEILGMIKKVEFMVQVSDQSDQSDQSDRSDRSDKSDRSDSSQG